MDTKVKIEDFMTGYEFRLCNGYKKTAGDLAKDKRMFSNTLKTMLTVEDKVIDEETGEEIYIPEAAKLIAKKLKYLAEHPGEIDLKEISSVLGESKIETETTLRGASELFGDIVNPTK